MNRDSLERRFNLGRVYLLMRNKAYADAPSLGIGLAIIAGLNLITILFGRVAFMNGEEAHQYFVVIIAAGLILSSLSLRQMHGRSGCDWLLLPATSLEKYLAALLSCVVIFPLAASGALIGLSALLSLLERAAGGAGSPVWHPFSLVGLRALGEYAAVAVAFVAGSAAFRKRAFIKTLGLSIGFVLACGLLVALGLALAFGSWREAFSISYDTGVLTVSGNEIENAEVVERVFTVLVDGVRLALVPLFSLAYGYLRVSEKEARDEVQ